MASFKGTRKAWANVRFQAQARSAAAISSALPRYRREWSTTGVQRPRYDVPVVEREEKYSGRKVTQVRIFDPSKAEAHGVAVGAYDDLDAHPDLVLWAGRVEQDGTVNITRQAVQASTAVPTRQAADLATHTDVNHLLDQSVGRAEHERYSPRRRRVPLSDVPGMMPRRGRPELGQRSSYG